MPVRKLPGTPTLGGVVFWKDIVVKDGWRVQYNATLDKATPLKPYRLIDSEDYLWASADSIEEFQSALPDLVTRFVDKKPLFTKADVNKALTVVLNIALTIATKGQVRGKKA
jgi:hypothetical protein